MLYPARVVEQLTESGDRFRQFVEGENAAFRAFRMALARLEKLEPADLVAELADARRAGALPSEEWTAPAPLVIHFAERFPHHRAAREWAAERLAGIPTVAVDGSEIKPTKDYSLPIAAVQVAWFENFHRPDGRYVKDVAFRLVHPDELARENADGFGIADQTLALRRFQLEVDKLVERMESLASRGWDGRPPVAFFDGSLVVSFAAQMLETLGSEYIAAICRLVATSERTGVPVVGYIDTSLAKDLSTMVAALGNLPPNQRVVDSRLLDPGLQWGDRTRALVCARDDVLGRYRDDAGRDYSREICFVYLKTNQLAAPARLDLPRWVLRNGLLEHVLDVVRAEVIVGNGYPYGIEAADACAVLGSLDREHFYRLLQDFAAHQGIDLRLVPKAASKRRRRA
jgi:hypothetical protein